VNDGNGLWVRADHDCSDPTAPEVLVSHPGRLTAIQIDGDEVVLAQDRLRSWPLFWSLEDGMSDAQRLVISDDATLMREAVSAPRLDARARREFLDAGFVTGSDTLLAGIHQTEQGTVVRIDRTTGRARTINHSVARFCEETDTVVDPEDPRPLPLITVDDPAIAMTIGINTSPMAGRTKGAKVTARQVKDRLDRELIGNVSLRVLPTTRPDAWEVQGRGELALAILVEQMRREGFELTVGKPQVVTRTIDGKRHEPIERMTIDVPEEYLGAVTQLMAARKGQMETMTNHGTGWIRMEFLVPARGLIGFRTQFLTETRGTGIASSIAEGYAPWAGKIVSRTTGSLVSDRAGAVTAYALIRLQDRGSFFVEPTQETYEGQVVGENPRGEDMDVNVVREKQQTNMRSSTADTFEALVPPRRLTLEEALEFAADDECVEVTPEAVRIRKVILNSQERFRENARRRRAEA